MDGYIRASGFVLYPYVFVVGPTNTIVMFSSYTAGRKFLSKASTNMKFNYIQLCHVVAIQPCHCDALALSRSGCWDYCNGKAVRLYRYMALGT